MNTNHAPKHRATTNPTEDTMNDTQPLRIGLSRTAGLLDAPETENAEATREHRLTMYASLPANLVPLDGYRIGDDLIVTVRARVRSIEDGTAVVTGDPQTTHGLEARDLVNVTPDVGHRTPLDITGLTLGERAILARIDAQAEATREAEAKRGRTGRILGKAYVTISAAFLLVFLASLLAGCTPTDAKPAPSPAPAVTAPANPEHVKLCKAFKAKAEDTTRTAGARKAAQAEFDTRCDDVKDALK